MYFNLGNIYIYIQVLSSLNGDVAALVSVYRLDKYVNVKVEHQQVDRISH